MPRRISSGDVNGDGYDDLIIGALFADPNGSYSGATYVVFGSGSVFDATLELASLDGANGFQINGETASDHSGGSVASAGDVNGDGFDDLIIGSRGADPNGNLSGASYVVFGSDSGFDATLELSALNGTNGFQINGKAAGDYSGWSVASAGDINGDGFDDLIIGAPFAYPNGSYSGATYVVFGSGGAFAAELNLSTLNGTNGFQINGEVAIDFSGGSVASAGDVNGDGFDDLIIRASFADSNGDSSGATYVVFGSESAFDATLELSDLDGTNGFTINGAAANDFAGTSVAAAGDVNGDGYDDLIVGAYEADPNGGSSGASYVIFGRAPDEAVSRTATNSANTIRGGAYDDTISGLSGDDVLYGAAGKDSLDGGAGNDILDGGADNDTLIGAAGRETLLGGAGDDRLDGGVGKDDMSGGAGNDTYFTGGGDTITENADEGTDLVLSSVTGTLGSNLENLTLSGAAKINGTGNALNNVITGNSSANTLSGLAGNDSLIGGAGNDTLMGGAGNDIYVADGADTITEASGSGSGTDTVQSSATYTLGANLENLTLTGSSAINGTGNALDNTLTGNSAANTLNGGTGKDLLTGAAGNDTFIFYGVVESWITATTADVIADFAIGKDKISLSAIDAFASSGSDDAFIWKGTAAFNSTSKGEVRYEKFDNRGTANDYTMVWIDNDADTGVEMAIRLTGLYNLAATDFIL